ncbi:MAG: hypothetical protein KGL90_01945 [Burkholderiales bacterium]|nr:hypothetical protein [Burkholderiales bacterium]
METINLLAVLTALALLASNAPAQPGPAAGPGASGPGYGMMGGPGGTGGRGMMGHGPGAGPGMDDTSGWTMMTEQERKDHQAKMRSMNNYDECRAYVDKEHQQMVARAKEKGRAMPTQPRRDACAHLKR